MAILVGGRGVGVLTRHSRATKGAQRRRGTARHTGQRRHAGGQREGQAAGTRGRHGEAGGASSRGHAGQGRWPAAGGAVVRHVVVGGVRLVLGQHGIGVGLALGGVGRGDGVDDGLGLLVTDLLVVVDDVAQVVAAAVVRLAHRHAVVRQVDIAVVAEDCVRA